MDKAVEGANRLRGMTRKQKMSSFSGMPSGEKNTGAVEVVVDNYPNVPECHPQAQELALRIWAGQSPDVAVIERVERIANALKDRGFPCAVTLPHPDAERYMKAHL